MMSTIDRTQFAWYALLTLLVSACCMMLADYVRLRHRSSDMPQSVSETVDFVVILVCGTFGWFSAWLNDGSALRTHVSNALGGHVDFHPGAPWRKTTSEDDASVRRP
ncbi:hypothetical protein GTP44_23905 [Duganella sp. FT50W]|uniref:Uncharacterized protein n=1 Tax=Duganella lactea TaxID=2692173 RepID=A0A6L8MSK4_9BURK|nr:hypothetical protein [Duganella lactea]MYM84979.1 hypothetical protein [Duganella lactea]